MANELRELIEVLARLEQRAGEDNAWFKLRWGWDMDYMLSVGLVVAALREIAEKLEARDEE